VERATFDTNALVSGLIGKKGAAPRLLALARDGAFALQLSNPILDETAGILAREFDWTQDRIAMAGAFLSSISQHVTPHVELDVVARDRDDNRILECSLASRSDYIITFDKDLLDFKRYGGADIIQPAEFLAMLWKKGVEI
jgi:putative PIN family toxin of toxin-antitoxin system